MLETNVYSALTTSTLITAYTGTRVYPLVAPQEPTYPYIIYTRFANDPVNTLLGYSTLTNPSFEIAIYSTSYNTVKTIRENVHKVFDETTYFQALLENDNDDFDDGLNTDKTVYISSLDFSIWGRE